ncbi:hypothetical protein TB2_043093 [Malus domestica]
MESKAVLSGFAVIAMTLLITAGNAVAEEERCFQHCRSGCDLDLLTPDECDEQCFQKCPVLPSLAATAFTFYPTDRCFTKCMEDCHLPKEVECANTCFLKCGFPPMPSLH